MEFKKIYDPASVKAGAPKVSHLRVRRATKRWFVSPAVIEQGVADGYFSLGGGKLTIKTADGQPDVVYKIVTPPGHYCCFDNKKLNDSREGAEYVKANFAGQASPDANNPSGWRRDNHYSLELESGIEAKPERPLGQALRYAKQQEDRRAAALVKLAKIDAQREAKLAGALN
jgi:hypothetical protein